MQDIGAGLLFFYWYVIKKIGLDKKWTKTLFIEMWNDHRVKIQLCTYINHIFKFEQYESRLLYYSDLNFTMSRNKRSGKGGWEQ